MTKFPASDVSPTAAETVEQPANFVAPLLGNPAVDASSRFHLQRLLR